MVLFAANIKTIIFHANAAACEPWMHRWPRGVAPASAEEEKFQDRTAPTVFARLEKFHSLVFARSARFLTSLPAQVRRGALFARRPAHSSGTADENRLTRLCGASKLQFSSISFDLAETWCSNDRARTTRSSLLNQYWYKISFNWTAARHHACRTFLEVANWWALSSERRIRSLLFGNEKHHWHYHLQNGVRLSKQEIQNIKMFKLIAVIAQHPMPSSILEHRLENIVLKKIGECDYVMSPWEMLSTSGRIVSFLF